MTSHLALLLVFALFVSLIFAVLLRDEPKEQLRFGLRRIPLDPMTNSTDWGLRSYQDKPDASNWGRQNVFDVYSKSDATALNGTRYRDW